MACDIGGLLALRLRWWPAPAGLVGSSMSL